MKVYFILVKISYYRALNTQERENWGILGDYDVIGGPIGKNFESVEIGENFYIENVLYSRVTPKGARLRNLLFQSIS